MLERRDRMKSWSPLVHQIYRLLKAHKIEKGRGYVAVSGGGDSLALLWVLSQLRGALNLDLQVLHVHHGPGTHQRARTKAQDLVRERAAELEIPFQAFYSEKELKSEAEFRKFRQAALRSAVEGGPRPAWIFTAHHLQDLLETRLIRLIRGTGLQGLKAIHVKRGVWVRPFLEVSQGEILKSLEDWGVTPWRDPSNEDQNPLRNWIRHSWLPELEKKRSGGVKSLGRSLAQIVEQIAKDSEGRGPVWLGPHTLSRGFFHTLGASEKQQVLAECLYRLQGLNYSSGQIKEIQKRLDNPKKEHTFRMKNSLWVINAEQISVRKVSEK